MDAPTASPFTMESVGGTHGLSDAAAAAAASGRDDNRRDSKNGGGGDGVMMRRDESSSESAVEDDLERGEAYEMQRLGVRRRSTTGGVE